MPVVQDTLVRPDLTPITKATVEIRLFLNGTDGVAYLASSEIFPKTTLHPDATGLISVTLPANSTLTPSGSYYQVDISIPGELRRTETIIVPAGAGPYLLGSILSVTPAAGIPFLSDALPLALAATALPGTDTKTSRDDHVHPLTGIATDAEVTAAVATHAGLADPHPTYLTASEGTAAYDPINAASSAITALKAALNTWTLLQTFVAGVLGPLFDKGGAVYHVKAYGAVVDGTTDDLAAIQAAVDACNAAGGGTVQLGTGTSILSAALVLKSNVTLRGAGWASVLKIAAASNQLGAIEIRAVSRVAVRDLKIDGNETNRTPGSNHGVGIYITNTGATNPTDILIQNVEITKAGNGIEGYDPQRLRIDGCWIHDTGTATWGNGGGITITGRTTVDLARDIQIRGNLIENVSEVGIAATWSDRVVVEGNTLNGTNGAARVGASDAAFSCNGSSNVRVSGNHFSNCSQGGLYVRDLDDTVLCRPARNVTIVGNTITQMHGSAALIIRGNTVSATTFITRGVIVDGNVFEANGQYAIQLMGLCEDIAISHNVFYNNCADRSVSFANYDIGVPSTGSSGASKRVMIQGNDHYSDNGLIGICVRMLQTAAEAFSVQGNNYVGMTNDGLVTSGTNNRIGLNYAATGAGNAIGPFRDVQTRTTAYTMTPDDNVLFCNATTAPFTVGLPTAVGRTGREFIVKKTDASANVVTIDPNAAETIEGAATYALTAQWQGVVIVSNGSNWLIVSKVA